MATILGPHCSWRLVARCCLLALAWATAATAHAQQRVVVRRSSVIEALERTSQARITRDPTRLPASPAPRSEEQIASVAPAPTPSSNASQPWRDARRIGPWEIRATFSLEEQAHVLRDMTGLQHDLDRILHLGPPQESVELYLFHNEDAYARHLKALYPGIPYRRALFAKGSGAGKVYAFRSEELDIDLRHEATHALLHAVLPQVPLWLDEGLAEYFELPTEMRAEGNPYQKTLVWRIRLGQCQSLSRLEARRDISEMGRAEYRDAWAWVHFLLHGPIEARMELASYLEELRQGQEPEPLSRRLERRLPHIERHLLAHFKSRQKPDR